MTDPVVMAEVPKKSSKVWLFVLLGVFVACICCSIIALLFVLIAAASPSAKDYLAATETPYSDVKTQVSKVEDSILNDYAVDASEDKYADIKAKVDDALLVVGDLETKVAEAEKTMPTNRGTDTEKLDANLKVYYQSTKELATTYKDLLTVHSESLPLIQDVEKMSTTFSSFEEPQTSQDYRDFGKKLKELKSSFEAKRDSIDSIVTTSETEFIKENLDETLTNVSDFLSAFITFTDKAATSLDNNDEALMTAAGEDLNVASEKFQKFTEDTSFKDQKKVVIESLKSKLENISQEQEQTDSELSLVKNSIEE